MDIGLDTPTTAKVSKDTLFGSDWKTWVDTTWKSSGNIGFNSVAVITRLQYCVVSIFEIIYQLPTYHQALPSSVVDIPISSLQPTSYNSYAPPLPV